MKNILKKIIILVTLIIMTFTVLKTYVNAMRNSTIDPNQKARLTITSYENSNKSTNKELAGVEFTLYYIPKDIETVKEAEEYITKNEVKTYAQTTPDNGKVIFSELELGRYLVAETKAPKNAVKRAESFLIDLPKTLDNGESFDYDITIFPKTESIYGKMILNKQTEDNKPLEGTEWNLQKLEQDAWVDYQYEGNLITNNNGIIEVQDLEAGSYRIYETKSKEGYILDLSNKLEFTINTDNITKAFSVNNEKPKIEKNIYFNGKEAKNIGVFKNDKITWKIRADVPSMITKMKTYYITDTLSEGLNVVQDSLAINATYNSGESEYLSNDKYSSTIEGRKMKIDFNTQDLKDIKSLDITYDTNFSEEVTNGEFSNNASITYTDKITADGEPTDETYTSEPTEESEAKIHMGSVLIYKVDDKGNALQGAQFKIATSKHNAEIEDFIKDKDQNDIVAISDENGYAIFDGLKYGDENEVAENASTSYWIVETKSPKYIEDGITKYYKLQEEPIEVKVNVNSHIYSKGETVEVVNKKVLKLPFTGQTFLLVLIPIILGIITILISYRLIKKENKK